MVAAQLRLLEEKGAEVEALRRRGGGPDDVLADAPAGIGFVLRTALLAGGLTEAEREELERREREAKALLHEATNHLRSPLRARWTGYEPRWEDRLSFDTPCISVIPATIAIPVAAPATKSAAAPSPYLPSSSMATRATPTTLLRVPVPPRLLNPSPSRVPKGAAILYARGNPLKTAVRAEGRPYDPHSRAACLFTLATPGRRAPRRWVLPAFPEAQKPRIYAIWRMFIRLISDNVRSETV